MLSCTTVHELWEKKTRIFSSVSVSQPVTCNNRLQPGVTNDLGILC